MSDRLVNKSDLPLEVEELSHRILGCAIEVHRLIGPGFIERVYEDALVYELGKAGLAVQRQVPLDVRYKEIVISGQRLDLMVNDTIIVEVKAVTEIVDAHVGQLLSYLRAADKPLGLLLNFHASYLKGGIDRVLNHHWSGLNRTSVRPSLASLTSPLRG